MVEFIISECNTCRKISWPPVKICNKCSIENIFREGDKSGKIVEFSKNNLGYFGMIEFENQVRVLGKIYSLELPKINQKVILKTILKKDNSYSFEVTVT